MSNTDRELLELAAKAAGLTLDIHENWSPGELPYFHLVEERRRLWNPLTDDGDALRLVVSLGIALDRTANRCWAGLADAVPGVCEDFYNADPYAATRRAIVRAAAEIGRASDD